MNSSGKEFLKWSARVVGAAVVAVAYLQWKHVTEMYELENGVMGTYRPIVLGLAYYLFWVFTNRFGGNSQKAVAPEPALIALFVCVGIAAGFFATQFAYVETIDRTASVMVAKSVGFIAFMVAAGAVIGVLRKTVKWQ